MTQPPEQNNRPNRRLWLMILSRFGIPLIGVGLVAIAIGAWYGWKFVNEDLAPLVQTSLSELLDRPVQLGNVQRVSINSLRFGRSQIPATPNDADRASVGAVDVAFNPLQLLLTRKLTLDVTLVQPDVYLDQDKDGVWTKTQIKSREDRGLIKTELQKIRFQNANIELAPFPKAGRKRQSIVLDRVTGIANFFDNSQRIGYELVGQSTKGGDVNVQGETIVNNGLNSNVNVRAQDFLASEVDRLVKFPIDLTQGRVNGNVNVQLRPNQRAIARGTADFKDVTVQIPRLPQTFAKSTGNLQVNDTLITLGKTTTQLGKVPLTASGKIDTDKGYDVAAQVKSVTLKNFFDTFAVQTPFAVAGEAAADVKVTGAIDRPIIAGKVRSTKIATVDRLTLDRASTDFRLDAGTLNLDLANIQATPTVGGQVTGSGRLRLNEPRTIAVNFQAQNVPGDAVARIYNNGNAPAVTIGRVNAQGQIVGRLDNVQTIARFQAPEATYATTGEVTVAGGNSIFRNVVAQVGGGTVTAEGRTIGDRWSATVRAAGVQANQFAAQVQGVVSATLDLTGSLRSFSTDTIQARGQARLDNGNQFVNANLNANAGRWQAATQIAGLSLAQFSPQLRGNLSGNVNVSGSLNAVGPENIRANGQVRLSQGISLIDQPLDAQINWDGRRLNIPQAIASGFQASGSILAQFSPTPRVTGLDLNVRTTGYALANLPIPRPPVTEISGAVDLIGRITGTPESPVVVADTVTVRGFSLNGITFDRVLNGNLRLASDGFSIRVAGQNDLISLALNPNFRPRSLTVKRNEATIAGITQGNIFRVSVRQFPIDGFVLPGVNLERFGGLGGRLAGNFNIDLDRLRVINGDATIADLRLGAFRAQTASTAFVNDNNVFRFSDTVLANGQSRYTLTKGTVDLRSKPRFNGTIAVAQGRIEDVLSGLQLFEIQDFARGLQPPTFGRAADVQPIAVGNPQAPLLDQIRRFSEIKALIQQTAQANQNNRTPEVADVRGNFGGTITVSAAIGDVTADFDLRAQNVELRPYRPTTQIVNGQVTQTNDRVLTADQVIALGSFNNGVVSLEPLRIQSGDARINLTGQFGGTTQTGQLEAINLPISEINRFYPLPLGLDGKLNATVTVSGTRSNPSAIGQLRVTDGLLNGTQVQSAIGNFNYLNSRLNFGSTIAISTNEPIRIDGSLPYPLLPDSVRPDSNQISLNLDVRNEGLAVLNLFTRQVAWRSGQGEAKLNVSGTLLRPTIVGTVNVADATIESTALQGPLTGVTGTIQFDRGLIQVNSLRGQFSRGQVNASGTLPLLSESAAIADNPLIVTLDNLALNRKGLYQGGVTGRISVLGTAFAPAIGGDIQLANGQVLLSNTSGGGTTSGNLAASGQPSVRLNHLKLTLGNNVQIVRAPLINFVANGALTVDGTLDAPKPEGTIRLRSGQVNLFTTQFVLERGYPQFARFERDRGLDPVLNVRLIAAVPEVTRSRIPTAGSTGFVDNSLFAASVGALQTVRIQARIAGPASQLSQDLELTSSPARSRDEIIALIGGGFVNTLAQGDITLGLANFASSALLTNVQTFIGNTLGFSEFRLFPTILRNEQRRTSSFGLAAEASVDITRNLSGSVLRILTADQPTQFGLRYRINNRLLFRGTTDFSGDTEAVLEYETRF